MAFCGKCGTTVAEGPGFCPNCGAQLGQPAAAAPPPYSAQPPYNPPPPPPYGAPPQYPPPQYGAPPTASGLQENVAAALSYVLGWLTGIIFLLIDKRPYVRFHAAQSIVVFGALHVLQILLAFVWVASYGSGLWGIHWALSSLVSLLTLVAWILLMVMAYQGKQFEVPVAGGFARSIAGKVN